MTQVEFKQGIKDHKLNPKAVSEGKSEFKKRLETGLYNLNPYKKYSTNWKSWNAGFSSSKYINTLA